MKEKQKKKIKLGRKKANSLMGASEQKVYRTESIYPWRELERNAGRTPEKHKQGPESLEARRKSKYEMQSKLWKAQIEMPKNLTNFKSEIRFSADASSASASVFSLFRIYEEGGG